MLGAQSFPFPGPPGPGGRGVPLENQNHAKSRQRWPSSSGSGLCLAWQPEITVHRAKPSCRLTLPSPMVCAQRKGPRLLRLQAPSQGPPFSTVLDSENLVAGYNNIDWNTFTVAMFTLQPKRKNMSGVSRVRAGRAHRPGVNSQARCEHPREHVAVLMDK